MAMTPSSKAYGDDEVRYLGVKRKPWDWERCADGIRRLKSFNPAEEAGKAHDLAVIRFQKMKAKTNFPIPVVSPTWGLIPGAVGRGRVIPVNLGDGGLHCHPAVPAAARGGATVKRYVKMKAKTNFPIPVVSPSWAPIPGAVGRGRVIPVNLGDGGLHCHPAVPAAARGGATVKGYLKIAPAPPKVLDLFPGARPETTGVVAGKTRRAPRGRGLRKTGPSAAVVEPPKTAPVSRGFELDLDLNYPPAEDRSLNLRLGLI